MDAAQESIQAAGKVGLESAGIYGVILEVRLEPGNNEAEAVKWGGETGKGRQAKTNLRYFLHLKSAPASPTQCTSKCTTDNLAAMLAEVKLRKQNDQTKHSHCAPINQR